IRYVVGSDAIAPVVASVNPAESATNSLHTGNITATFSEGLNPATVSGTAFRLIKQGTSTPVAATVTYDTATRTATLDPTASLELATSYIVTLQGGVGGITDQAGNPMAASKTWTFTTATVPPAGQSYLSDLGWTLMVNGWGPAERDRSNGDDAAGDGGPLRLNGVNYTKGLGVHASSEIRFTLGGTCSTLTSDVGVDDEMGVEGSIVFQVWGDAVKLYDSGIMTGTTATKSVSVDLTGKNELRLIVTDAADGIGADHGDWANARITCTGGGASDTTPPTISSRLPAPGATNVAVTARVTAVFSEAMDAATLTPATVFLTASGTTTPVAASVTYDQLTRTVTLAPGQALSTSTTFTATLKGGTAGAKDLAGNPLVADQTWTFQTAATGANTRYLSDLTWTSAVNGWGPVERDRSNGDINDGDGQPILLNGVTYAKGLGVHAASDVRFPLGGTCSTFQAAIGLDDEVGAGGSVNFQVWADGAQLFGSTLMTGASATALVNVDISGRNELRLVVTDGGDNIGLDHADWAEARITCVSSNNKPVPTISAPLTTFRYKVGDVVAFTGSATDQEDGNIPANQLSWAVKIHHCPGGICHVHNFTTATGASGSFTVPDHGDDSYFEVILTALDSGGLSDSASRNLQPLTVPLTLASNPAGLQIVAGGTAMTAPVTWNSIVGSTHSIFAPSPQGSMAFQSWSDGKAQQHDIVVGTTAATYTAVFTGTDTAPPIITSRIPVSGGTNVSVTTNVTAIFSESLQTSTVTSSNVTLLRAGTTTPLAATVAYDNAARTITLTPTQPLLFATSYTATIKGGATGVKDLAGNALVGDQTWTFQTANAPSFTKYVSDLSFTLATNSWGPVERDKSNGESIAGDGGTITLNGVTYTRGLGVHAHSDVRFQLGGSCSTFQSDIGIDDEVGVRGSVAFQVWADGAQIFSSSLMTGSSATVRINLNVGGKSELRLLVTDGGNGIGSDHADWADARLTCTDTTAPVVSGHTPANAATGVSTTPSITATFAEEMKAASVTTTTMYLTAQGTTTPVAAAVTYSADLRRGTLVPAAPLQRNRQYTVTVKGGAAGVKDLADLPMAADRVWTFTTLP
ncbi:MAG: NPCBM/NEW2 domain-containing protein, partial [Bryobacterales bacterium]|nr:NPCBM/NEW2 domain-containing protein [Bryobacterales bacterium]